MLTVAAFAGLRDSEIKRLDWNEVNLERGFSAALLRSRRARQKRQATAHTHPAESRNMADALCLNDWCGSTNQFANED